MDGIVPLGRVIASGGDQSNVPAWRTNRGPRAPCCLRDLFGHANLCLTVFQAVDQAGEHFGYFFEIGA